MKDVNKIKVNKMDEIRELRLAVYKSWDWMTEMEAFESEIERAVEKYGEFNSPLEVLEF